MRGTRSERTMRWSLDRGSKPVNASITVPNEIGLEPTATLHRATTKSKAMAQPVRPAAATQPGTRPRGRWTSTSLRESREGSSSGCGEAHARRATVEARPRHDEGWISTHCRRC